MDNYTKGETVTVYDPPSLTMEGAVDMKVTEASKIRNVMRYAMSAFGKNNVRHLIWNGNGNAISKTISCAEIMKRNIKGLHQISQIGYVRVEDFWEPNLEGLDRLKVNTNIPTISILLSKDPLDENHPSYQAAGSSDILWSDKIKSNKKENSHRKLAAIRDVKNAASKPKRPKGSGKDTFKPKKADAVQSRIEPPKPEAKPD